MYSESSIIANIIGFLGEGYAGLPVLKTDLETIIGFSSAVAEMYRTVNDGFNNINQKTRIHYAKMIKEANKLAGLRAEIGLEQSTLEGEKDAWAIEKSQFENMQSFESTIKLNIGGHRYCIALSTLRQYPDTMLGAMFSGRHTLISDADGSFFIDRDGTHFRYILNLLRTPETFKVAGPWPCQLLFRRS